MRATGTGREINLKPVDEDRVMDHPARAGLEALMDQKLFHQRIRSERASAYWFAASLWGVTGLILGAFLGAYITLAVQERSADVWRNNFIAGAAADAARETVDGRPSLVNPDRDAPPPAVEP
jgi:hypothetical protein